MDKIKFEYNIRRKSDNRLVDILYEEFTEDELSEAIRHILTMGRWSDNEAKIDEIKIDSIVL